MITFMFNKNKRLISIFLTVAVLLLIPLIAMQFTDEVDWNLVDFLIAGILLLGIGLGCEVVIRNVKRLDHRIAICLGMLIMFLLLWAELAIGIFGTTISGS